METDSTLFATLFSVTPPNIVFTILIAVLVVVDLVFKKDLKAQIVSVGVLGTFVGIFIGLQNFDPESMKNSVHSVLVGLKTAFATSILGMSSAIFLSIYQKIRDQISDDNKSEEELLAEINSKLANMDSSLSYLPRMDNSSVVSKLDDLVKGLSNIKVGSSGSDESEAILKTLIEIRNHEIKSSFAIQEMLSKNFEELNSSMEEATRQLSKGATQEIIDALQGVISDFNNNLTEQFGGNFDKLNQAVFKLVEWQDNYKNHVEDMEKRLQDSTSSIESAKDSIVTIANENERIIKVYDGLSDMIKTAKEQSDLLQKNLSLFTEIIPKTEEMFKNMDGEFNQLSESFKELSLTVVDGNRMQRDSFVEMNSSIVDLINENGEMITNTFRTSMDSVTESFKYAYDSLERQRYEINVITNHFRVMGEQIPEALRISLDELNSALTSITTKFQRDYEELIYKYKDSVDETRF
jgi:chromosome segregation ATPase